MMLTACAGNAGKLLNNLRQTCLCGLLYYITYNFKSHNLNTKYRQRKKNKTTEHINALLNKSMLAMW